MDEDNKASLQPLRQRRRLKISVPAVKNEVKFDVKSDKLQGMNAKELFNLAIADPSLEDAVCLAYKQKYPLAIPGRASYVSLVQKPIQCRHQNNTVSMGPTNTLVNVIGQEISRQYVDLFGTSIRSLLLDYVDMKSQLCGKLNQSILNRCAPTLKAISIERMPKQDSVSIFDVKRPFQNADHVVIHYSDLGARLSRVSTCFPNVRHLQLDSNIVGSYQAKFPHLQHLKICDHENRSTTTAMASLWTAHPKLCSLTIIIQAGRPQLVSPNGIPMNTLLKSIEKHQALHTLIVKMKLVDIAPTRNQLDQLIREHKGLHKLHLELYKFSVKMAIDAIRGLTSLHELKYHVDNAKHKMDLYRELAHLSKQGLNWTDTSEEKNIVFLKRRNIKLEEIKVNIEDIKLEKKEVKIKHIF